MFNRIRRLFGGASNDQSDDSEAAIEWLAPVQNPWPVPVLDVRPVTLGMLSTSTDRKMAENAISYGGDDGTGFIGQTPPNQRESPANLFFPTDGPLYEGALFIPSTMEHKWAIFFHGKEILFVRSWLRRVQAIADITQEDSGIRITCVRGVLTGDDEPPGFTIRTANYLLRSHALSETYPAPLPQGLESNPRDAALWCFNCFGNQAQVATQHDLSPDDPAPSKPLRSFSMLHIAIARSDREAALRLLGAGVPIDVRDPDGLTPMQWSLSSKDMVMAELLLERGCPVDAATDDRTTSLMFAVQEGALEKVTWLLDHGAQVEATDHRGFTPLHRAAEMGHRAIVGLLLERGATVNVEAEGNTPRSLAEQRNETAILALLDGHNQP